MTCTTDLVQTLEDDVLESIWRLAQGSEWGPTETFYFLRSVMAATGINRDYARAACRSLTDRGLLQYRRGLFSDDGITAGAGYGLTHEGISYLREKGVRS